ncbi:C2H2-type zinc finger family protein [Perilla frutescens var. hirtella]|uniref:C2H2-type zinc finger family protein n=1 Tax=Perilla frutescens var. hirtella TaxID=608512 RepID=A0AAD4P6E4_PERFH|nr:C2H2-type zinc finger family protein [Perilla frutescens var. hirtella]
MMKRRRDGEADEISAMANCLMLLSAAAAGGGDSSRVFTCKTCNRQFPSFQALGGHRASHKKPRLVAGDLLLPPSSPPKPKTHECSICGQEFPLGQALGGHMRRHRAALVDQNQRPSPPLSLFPVVKKPNNKRVLYLDLNLTPLENQYFLIASSQI